MSNLKTLLANMQTSMQALAVPGERFAGITISAHGGEFNSLKELERYAKRAPAVVLAILKYDTRLLGGEPWADLLLGAFCLCQDKVSDPRTTQVLGLAENVTQYITVFPGKSWGVGARSAEQPIGRNLYNASLDERGVSLWGVFWKQTVQLVAPSPPVQPSFSELHADWDLAPRANGAALGVIVDATDVVNLDP